MWLTLNRKGVAVGQAADARAGHAGTRHGARRRTTVADPAAVARCARHRKPRHPEDIGAV